MGSKTSTHRREAERGPAGTSLVERDDSSLCDNRSDAPTSSSRRFLPRGPWATLKGVYNELINAIIRPPRAEYTIEDLGAASFRLAGRQYERVDLNVPGAHGLALAASWWRPVAAERQAEQLPCVVYMHGNSSCRLEALDILQVLLHTGITLFAFDFAGCGLSQGDNITLGYREKDDAMAVVNFLRASGSVSTIALWGRSMGAATALLHGHRDPSLAAMVLDSPFASLERLAREVVDRAQLKHKPSFLVNAGLKLIRRSVLQRTGGAACRGLDILKLRPIQDADCCYIPAMFVAGADDQFISPRHATDIFELYAGDKSMTLVEGGHNTARPRHVLDSIAIFLYNTLCVPSGLTEENLGLRPRSWNSTLQAGEEAFFSSNGDSNSASRAQHRSMIRSQLDASRGAQDDVSRLVGCATDRAQSTLPHQCERYSSV